MPDSTATTPKFGPILPWTDVVLCKEAPEETTEEGIYIGKDDGGRDANKKPEKGIVVAVGPSSDPDKKPPYDIEPGDLIFFERYTANFIPDKNVEYNFIRFKFIMGAKKQVKENNG